MDQKTLEEIQKRAEQDISNLENVEHSGYISQEYAHDGAAITMRALLAEVKRLKKENAVLKAELQDSHQDHVDDFMRLKTENATLKKALELMVVSLRENNFNCPDADYFIQQAQEQEAKDEKA